MKTIVKLSLVSFLFAPFALQAVTLDYRHEYKADSKSNADRLKLSHTTEEGYFFSVEGKMAESTKSMSDGFKEGGGHYSGNGSEWEMARNFRVTDQLTLAPGINLDVGDTFVGYRAQIKAIYKLSDDWVTTLRWRPGIQVDENPSVPNKNYNQFNWEFGYTGNKFTIMGDFEYRVTNYDDYKGEHNYWLYNIVASVPLNKQWTPYSELGLVPRYNTDHDKDDMEMRYRLGLRYNF